MNVNSLVICGNGFDLAHRLETSYSDVLRNLLKDDYSFFGSQNFKFLKSISNSILFDLTRNKDNFLAYMNNTLEIKDGFTGENIYKSHKYNTDAQFKNLFLSNLLSYIHKLKKWIDIETFYFERLLTVKTEESIVKLNNDFKQITDYLENYLYNEWIKNPPKKIQEMQNIFDTICNGIASKNGSPIEKQTLFVNFNYTTTENLYDLKNCKIVHIHGKLKNVNNSIIFGYGDEISEDSKKIELVNNNEYLRNTKSIRYNEADNYKEIINFIESNHYEVFIIGHSCGISDRTLLNIIFEHPNCKFITPYYHQGKENNNKFDLTTNIYRNFKSENKEVFRKIVESQNKWKPLPQAVS